MKMIYLRAKEKAPRKNRTGQRVTSFTSTRTLSKNSSNYKIAINSFLISLFASISLNSLKAWIWQPYWKSPYGAVWWLNYDIQQYIQTEWDEYARATLYGHFTARATRIVNMTINVEMVPLLT